MTEPLVPQMPREFRVVVVTPSDQPPVETVLRGRCWVVDGDTIVINKTHRCPVTSSDGFLLILLNV